MEREAAGVSLGHPAAGAHLVAAFQALPKQNVLTPDIDGTASMADMTRAVIALASLTSLPLAGHACIAAACAFTLPPRSPTANDHEVLNGFGRRLASGPAMLPTVTAG